MMRDMSEMRGRSWGIARLTMPQSFVGLFCRSLLCVSFIRPAKVARGGGVRGVLCETMRRCDIVRHVLLMYGVAN